MTTILPGLSVLFAVLATAVPWGLPGDATFILPLVMVAMVFCWRSFPGVVFSSTLAMLLGLLADLMSGGPLGFFALMMLTAATAGGYARPLAETKNYFGLWVVCALLIGVLACFGWLLASLYFVRWIDWWPIAFGALASIALFPVVLYGLLWIKRGGLEMSRSATYRGWT
jgi:rod shape-determining protein MreD